MPILKESQSGDNCRPRQAAKCLNALTNTTGRPFLSGEEFLALPQKQRKWLIKPLLPAGAIINLYGKPKTGKSFASLGMGLAIANGDQEWNGFSVQTTAPVMYLQIDTPEGEMWDRLTDVKKAGYDVSRIYLADLTIAPYPYNVLQPQHQNWLAQEVARLQPAIVFIDTLREAHEEDENDSKDMKKVINALVKICFPAAVGLISHSRKDSAFETAGAAADIMDAGRGSSYVSGRMDTVIRFTGRDGKGHMEYKGRSKGANGKIPIYQDEDTGLVFIQEDAAAQQKAIQLTLRAHPEWSVNKHATHLVETGIYKAPKKESAIRTATRHLKAFLGQPTDE
jgi:RecA-family ATPase